MNHVATSLGTDYPLLESRTERERERDLIQRCLHGESAQRGLFSGKSSATECIHLALRAASRRCFEMSTSATVRSSVAQRRLGAIIAQQRCVERSSAAQTVWCISDVQCSSFHFWQGLGDQFRSAAGTWSNNCATSLC